MTKLTKGAILTLLAVFVAFANAAPSTAREACIVVLGKYFVNGKQVETCGSHKAERYKRDGDELRSFSPQCVGKPKGHSFVHVHKGRLMQTVCH